MARGWESKAVDDQIAAAAAADGARARPGAALTVEAREALSRRTELRLSRTRALQDLQLACDRRHRALLERTIAHLDAELAVLDRG